MWTIAGASSSVWVAFLVLSRALFPAYYPGNSKIRHGYRPGCSEARADIDNVLNEGANLGVYWIDPDAVVQRVQVRRRGRRDFMRYFGQRRNFFLLVGVAYSWFAIDASFFHDQARSQLVSNFILASHLKHNYVTYI
jgi:hypothetical protein